MKRPIVITAVIGFVLVAAMQASAESHRVSIHADYNVPVSTDSIGSNLEFGAQYRFWGIFQFNASIFTNFNYGVSGNSGSMSITPAGLFSVGAGMKIPLGGFAIELGWSRFFTGFGDSSVYHFSDSFNFGLAFDFNDRFGVRFYDRTLYGFTTQAMTSTRYGLSTAVGRVSTLGAGAVIHLF